VWHVDGKNDDEIRIQRGESRLDSDQRAAVRDGIGHLVEGRERTRGARPGGDEHGRGHFRQHADLPLPERDSAEVEERLVHTHADRAAACEQKAGGDVCGMRGRFRHRMLLFACAAGF
jgi:hypothetical protein